MDTPLLHPAHTLLGVTPDTAAKGRTKVITALIAISLVTASMIAQDMHLIRDSAKIISQKVRQAKARRSHKPLKISFE